MSVLVLGVDGGGTGSRAVLVDSEQGELARVTGGPAVADGDPRGAAVRQVTTLCRQALAQVGVEGPVDALWAGLAGAGRALHGQGVEEGLQATGLARRVRVGPDVEAAFHAAFPAGPGILILAGTGSVAVGRGPDGREGRSGGWGPLVGDEGSGYRLAVEAIRAVLQAGDGRGPATRLRAVVLQAMELEDSGDVAQEVVAWTTEADRRTVAAMAPRVVEVAHEADSVASGIVESAVQALLTHGTALELRLGPWADPPQVALAGGLLAPGGPLSDLMAGALTHAGFGLLGASPDAAQGAAALALEWASQEDRES